MKKKKRFRKTNAELLLKDTSYAVYLLYGESYGHLLLPFVQKMILLKQNICNSNGNSNSEN